MDGRDDDVAPVAAAVGAAYGPVFNGRDFLAEQDLLALCKSVDQGFAAAFYPPDAVPVGIQHVPALFFPACGEAEERFVTAHAFIGFHLEPGKVAQSELAEDQVERLAGPQSADGVEAGVEADAVADKSLQGSAGLRSLFQERDGVALSREDPSAHQAAQSGADDDDLPSCHANGCRG